MKKYSVNVHYDMVASVDVLAEDEETALDLAEQKADTIPLNELECVGTEKCVTDSKEISDEEVTNTTNAKIAKICMQRTNQYDDLIDCVNLYVEYGDSVTFDGKNHFAPRIIIDCGGSVESANIYGVSNSNEDIKLAYRSEYEEEGEISLMTSKNILYLDEITLIRAMQAACE